MQLSNNAMQVLERRFLTKNKMGEVIETPEEMFQRVARTISGAERDASSSEYEERFYKIMTNLEFLPNSPTLVNAGRELGQLSACFVLPIDDSMESIFTTLRDAALVQKSGGGCGFDFSHIRPVGDRVRSTNKCAGGPVAFIKIYDRALDVIRQGGIRHGANMAVLRVDHPDIIEFIQCKQNEKDIPNFNISVGITDDFISAVRNNRKFQLINPRSGTIEQEIPAKEIFKLIVDGAWSTGEPGVLFLDEMNRHNVVPNMGEIEATNPCVSGDTMIATSTGWRRADTIRIGEQISTILGVGKVDTIEQHKSLPVFRVTLADGASIKVTASHKFHAIKSTHGRVTRAKETNNKWQPIRLDKLQVGDYIRIAPTSMPNNPITDIPIGISEFEWGLINGILLGDGCITTTAIKNRNVSISTHRQEDKWNQILINLFNKINITLKPVGHKIYTNSLKYCASNLSTLLKKSALPYCDAPNKYIPDIYKSSNKTFMSGLLNGLFSTDGNVNLSGMQPQIRLTTSSIVLAKDVRLMLLQFGIHGRITKYKRPQKHCILGRQIQNQHDKYDITISGASAKIFIKQINMIHPAKADKLRNMHLWYGLTGNTWYSKITSIKPEGVADVYDIHDPISDTWIADGMVQVGCGEQPLLGYESCNLGSINLSRFVKNKQIDFQRLEYVVHLAVRFLDDVIDMNRYPITQIETRTKATRKIGLGVMGFADMMIKLGIKYDTDEAVKLAHQIFSFIHTEAIKASNILSETRGVFPAYRGSTWHTERGIRLRNACVTTVAPTGTLSIIANCSSGVEPYYSKSTKKHILSTILEEEVEFAKEDCFITAHDISPDWHIKIQSAFQAHSDSAVSKTINFPNSATRDDIAYTYLLAYKLKCKGITVYRDGSRSEQVLHKVEEVINNIEKCPNCGANIEMSEGCKKCSKECGWSACTIS